MEEPAQEGALTPRAAALALADARRGGERGRHVRAAVDAQIRRTGLGPQDADDVRSEVALALLLGGPDERLHPHRVYARAAAIARNKSVDVVRRQRRARPADGAGESPAPEPTGRLLGGLDAVQAEAHLRLVRPHLQDAIGGLGERERAVLAAHVAGSAHAAAGLSRSTFYRVLADTREQLQSRLAAAIAAALLAPARLLQGLAGLGGPAAAGGAAVVTMVVVVVVSLPGASPAPRPELPASESATVLPAPRVVPPVRTAIAQTRPARVAGAAAREAARLPDAAPVDAPTAAAPVTRAALPPPVARSASGADVCPYDPSSYYC